MEHDELRPLGQQNEERTKSDEVQDIITAVPKWIVRWGITLIFAVLFGIVLGSALIEYPDVVTATLKVNSLNSPKFVLAKQNGKLAGLLVEDGMSVKENQPLGYLESNADTEEILRLSDKLKKYREKIINAGSSLEVIPANLRLGELQAAYQTFYQQYLQFQSTQNSGYYVRKMAYLKRDLASISGLKKQILSQQAIQQQAYKNEEAEYEAYQKLYNGKVISRSEFAQQENKYFSSKYPLQQSETSIITNDNSYNEKTKEMLDLAHTIEEEKSKFLQSLNQCITEIDGWILRYVLTAPISGKIGFAGIVQKNQNVLANQEIFIVNPGNTDFFGEVFIPQYNMGKIKIGSPSLVKLHSFPFEQFGMIRGKLTNISDVAYRDSVFIGKVSFNKTENKTLQDKIVLKNGMQGNAEIITEKSSLLGRFIGNLKKVFTSG